MVKYILLTKIKSMIPADSDFYNDFIDLYVSDTKKIWLQLDRLKI